jgi:N-acetylglucosaminyldiphosphoundecaprenol N-acetyl-beta-D-mannosaminyltransferase
MSYQQILGIRFFTGSTPAAVDLGLQGGLVVVPAAPALVELSTNESYREALLQADLVITDSGLMVLLWRLLSGQRLPRVSGLGYLKRLLDIRVLLPGTTLWIMPGPVARAQNLAWLQSQGYAYTTGNCYVAPHYPAGPIVDADLTALLQERRPRHVVVCLGGGTQERLGLAIKRTCDFPVSIHCIGAAIGFLSGNQVNIPPWADRFFLGWLFRCLSEPGKFLPRYWRAVKLVPMMWRYREKMPEPVHFKFGK